MFSDTSINPKTWNGFDEYGTIVPEHLKTGIQVLTNRRTLDETYMFKLLDILFKLQNIF